MWVQICRKGNRNWLLHRSKRNSLNELIICEHNHPGAAFPSSILLTLGIDFKLLQRKMQFRSLALSYSYQVCAATLTDLKNTMNERSEKLLTPLDVFCFFVLTQKKFPRRSFAAGARRVAEKCRPLAERWQHFGCLTLIARTLRDELLDNAEISWLRDAGKTLFVTRPGGIFTLYEISSINRSPRILAERAFVLTSVGAPRFRPPLLLGRKMEIWQLIFIYLHWSRGGKKTELKIYPLNPISLEAMLHIEKMFFLLSLFHIKR
jgi:hypothetical protein